MERKHRPLYDFPAKVQAIITEECERAGVHHTELLTHDQHARLCPVRYAIWSRQRDLRLPNGTQPSYPHIGRMWGRDHTTIWRGSSIHRGEWTGR